MSHTPAPWRVGLNGIDGPNGLPILDTTCSYDIQMPSDEDMRLIAAAPDLLAALKDARRALYAEFFAVLGERAAQYPVMIGIDTAIAKAEGR